ncbi:PLP-dependent aminotransferase family protein [Cocleimonas flava]|uniref:GntR family transcriptional regulator n=1 Tax=Cocleimonas flava TaxID=634765 RepID=A0A4V2P8Y4_9GAMM|nr:PLP-dependent aminotransferase family protein [Cocleimonas flava]TCJ87515.1 GntR family transcriptional regulator [Cocleimonas flava]
MKYKDIAEQIIVDIQRHKLTPGQRLPSLRQLTKQMGVSMTTALNSYHNLEQRGWVVAHPKSGFFVSKPVSQGDIPTQPQFKSSSRQVSKNLEPGEYHRSNSTSGPFGITHLCPSNVPLLSLQRSIKRSVQRNDSLLHAYSDPQGIYELRQALVDHFGVNGFTMTPEDIFISGGCMDAIRVALLATTKPGDAVAISSPCFNGLLKLLSSMSRLVVEIPSHSDGVDLQQLEQKFKNKEIQAALFSSSYMNPHGISLSIEQKQSLAQMANKYRIPIIEDDVYSELGYEHTFPLPIKYWDTDGYVLWCSSVSKSLANGLRIGWCSAGRYLESCVEMNATERFCQNGLLQASLADFMNSGQYRKHLQNIRKIIFANACAFRDLLLHHLPKGSAVSAPSGGLALWIQVPDLQDVKLKAFADEANIEIRLGSQFTTRKLYHDYFRLNLGWGLSEMHDSKRTIEQALIELSTGVHKALGKSKIS